MLTTELIALSTQELDHYARIKKKQLLLLSIFVSSCLCKVLLEELTSAPCPALPKGELTAQQPNGEQTALQLMESNEDVLQEPSINQNAFIRNDVRGKLYYVYKEDNVKVVCSK